MNAKTRSAILCTIGALCPGAAFAISIAADPPYAAIGGSTTLSWNVPNASSCMVTANGYNLWGGTKETVNTALYGGNLADTTYTLTCVMLDGSQQTAQTTVLVPVSVPASDFTFDAKRGGNLFDGDFWLSNGPADAPIAGRMNLNFVRINIDMADAVKNGTESQLLDDLSATMDAFEAQDIKVILVFGGYIEYQDACGPYLSFLDVQSLAAQIVDTFRGHPALYAWELMNEAYSTMDDGYGCDHDATNQAVHAMFQLVHTADPATPTTVSEAWYWWYIPTWADVSSFAEFHIYPQVTSPLTPDQIDSDQSLLATNIDEARGAAGSLPLVLGEFGVTGLSPSDAAQWYEGMYETLKSKDIASFFWDLSETDSAYGVLNSDGSLTKQAQAIQSELGNAQASPPPPPLVVRSPSPSPPFVSAAPAPRGTSCASSSDCSAAGVSACCCANLNSAGNPAGSGVCETSGGCTESSYCM